MSAPDLRPTQVLLDPKGDGADAVLSAAACTAPDRLAHDVYVLNPFEQGFEFNLAKAPLGETPPEVRALQAAGHVSELSTGVGGQKHLTTGAKQADVLQILHLAVLTATVAVANFGWVVGLVRFQQVVLADSSETRSCRSPHPVARGLPWRR